MAASDGRDQLLKLRNHHEKISIDTKAVSGCFTYALLHDAALTERTNRRW